mmetsp:Transcript_20296/g.22561  ORF Transcript_20296/g.22561 Transcript_20296/m.22561 type:complete len:316 (+) Transcript_20296:59-1006(+)|eukprot:CAMPEP_0168530088 /NCGR_PEP_ID=MMETSP0405-20121227/14405_1 /TAXON_ID=498012 /ORGANISM="Trichosphaerium sp, Strain Am-I-7 wt" /LENGTH=315 /DNA_ID=CAMNT_0008554155 /DNA_START=33 /DNA_END=980 /DNA_ORIENTATION=+
MSEQKHAVGQSANSIRNAAEKLQKSFKSGDMKPLIEILSTTTHTELLAISAHFARTYDDTLKNVVLKKTSGDFKDVCLALIMGPYMYKAKYLNEAMKGIGANEQEMVDVICQSTPNEIKHITAAYGVQFGEGSTDNEKIVRDVKSETGFNLKKVFLNILEGRKPNSSNFGDLETVAEELYKKGEGRMGTNNKYFVEIFSTKSRDYLSLLAKEYAVKNPGHTLEGAVKTELSGNYRTAMLALITDKIAYFAERARQSIAGLGTNERGLVYSIVSLTKQERIAVSKYYAANFSETLQKAISGDTSGDLELILLSLIS